MKYISFIILIVLTTFYSHSQNVVVSEYYNVTGDPTGEWTELIVVSDNTSLVGFTLRDNAGSSGIPSRWTGGVRFKDHPLWRNLRAGTIIVINHRYNPFQNVDTDKRDGYIELDAENETFFEKRCFSCIVGPDWYNVALNIAEESDIIEIIDQNDNHIHSLAHMPNPSGSWTTMPDPKISSQGSINRSGVSVRVCPGKSLQSYNKGFDSSGEEVEFSTNYITKGKPNNRAEFIDQNQVFWRSLRQPIWRNPVLYAKIFRDSVVLNWNSIDDPYPSDSTQGYLILRIPFNQINSAQNPIDGKLYNIGDFLGSAVVVGLINYSQTTSFVDRFSLPCGEKFIYRIFSFRFRSDDLREDNREVYARGRSYNENNFGQVQVEKPIPNTPFISTENDKIKFCEGDSSLIYLNSPQSFTGYRIYWLVDNNIFDSNRTKVIVNTKGTYKAKVIDSLDCYSFSNEISIDVVPLPRLTVLVNSKEVQSDTTIVICPNDSVELRVYGWTSFKWYKDSLLIQEGRQSKFIVSQSGNYWVQASNDICSVKTYVIKVKVLSLKISYLSNFYEVNVDKFQAFKDTVILLHNQSNDTVLIKSVSFTDTTFKLISPSLPVVLFPDGEIEFIIRFQPVRSGLYYASMLVEKECSSADTIKFTGIKEQAGIISSNQIVDFGVNPLCQGVESFVYKDLIIYNAGSEKIEIINCKVSNPFLIVQPTFPLTLLKDENINIKFEYKLEKVGIDNGLIIITFRTNNIIDSLMIPIRVEVAQPEYEIVKLFADPIELSECLNETKVKFMFINKSRLPLKFIFNDSNPIVQSQRNEVILNAFDSSIVEFLIQPKKIGLQNTNYFLTIDPCNISDSLNLQINKNGLIVLIDPDSIDFGDLEYCNTDSNFIQKISLKVINSGGIPAKIVSCSIDEPFGTNFIVDSIIEDSTDFIVFLKPPSYSGEFFCKASLVIEPCNLHFEIPVRARTKVGSYSISPSNLNFENVEIGVTKKEKIYFENIGSIPITVSGIKGLNPPFSLSSQIVFPIIIEPNKSFEIEIVFQPDSSIDYSTFLSFIIDQPCYYSEPVFVFGRGVFPYPSSLFLHSEEVRAKPFRIIEVPIKLESDQTGSIRLSSINFEVNYNYRIFNLYEILIGSGIVFVDTMRQTGRILFNLGFDTTSSVKFTTLALLKGMVMLGDSRSTDLEFINAVAYGDKPVSVRTQSGKIITDSVCAIDLRLLQWETIPFVSNYEYDQNYLKINVSDGVNEGQIKVYIFDILGNVVFKTLTNLVVNKDLQINLPIDFLPVGIYFVRLEISGFTNNFRFIKLNY